MAMCDYETVDHSDLVAADRVSREYTGEIFYLQHNENQKWYWISDQKPEEMLLFINYDSDPRGGPLCKFETCFLRSLLTWPNSHGSFFLSKSLGCEGCQTKAES